MKKLSFSFLTFFTILQVLNLSSESIAESDYHPPMELPLIVTGTFGELRSTHFHGGVDFSTGRKIGKKVFAVAEGHVSRIKVAPDGYGNALYIKLKDGNTAVYGHLNNFSYPIQERLLKEQIKHTSSFLDFNLTPHEIPIARGQFIGKSGDSGGVPPHLHFELREKFEKLLNPLLYGFSIPDTTAPKLTSIALIPLDPHFVPLAKKEWKIVKPVWDVKTSQYTLPRQNLASAYTGIEIAIVDDSFGNKCAPSRVVLKEKGNILFERDYTTFSFEEFPQNFVVYNRLFWLEGKGNYERLYALPNSTLTFEKFKPDQRGVLHFKEGETRNFTVQVEDAAKNKTNLSFALSRSSKGTRVPSTQLARDFTVLPKKKSHYIDPEGRLKLHFPKRSVYFPTPISVQSISKEAFEKMPFLSPIYELSPKEALFKQSFKLSFQLPKGKGNLYEYNNRKKNWQLVKNQKREKGEVIASIKSLGIFALIEDKLPPQIKPVHLVKNDQQASELNFNVKDNLSGVDYRGIQILNQKKPLIFGVNLNKREVRVPLNQTNPNLANKIHILVPDLAQNKQSLVIDLSQKKR